jgi:hypothetical protein
MADRIVMLARLMIFCCLVLTPTAAFAQWWSPFAPRDYEDCAAAAEKTEATPQARAVLLSECDTKFAGRRKPEGGYTYYDFMQNRHFDIAGPNPTPDELKRFDEEYAAFLEQQRRHAIAAALIEKQRQQTEANADPAGPNATTGLGVVSALPRSSPTAAAHTARTKPERCTASWLSCTWSTVSTRTRSLFASSGTDVRPPRPIPAQ